jgi:uncharacterized protein
VDEKVDGLNMYTKYLKVDKSKTSGNGVFTTIEIPAGVPIIEFRGTIFVEKDLPEELGRELVLQVGPNTFLGPSGTTDDYINHSCDPNCRVHIVGNRAILYSLYVIPEGAELNFDYSTNSTDTHDTWKMECKCGSNKCRKVISGHQYLDPSLREEYKKKGMIPLFITFPHFHKR